MKTHDLAASFDVGILASEPLHSLINAEIDVLVIEADSPTMQGQGCAAATAFLDSLRSSRRVVVVRGGTKEQLCRDLGELRGVTTKVVILIGHANRDGVLLGSGDDELTDWAALSNWLKPFEPHTVFLVGCWTGSNEAADFLFGIRTVRDVYASPSKTAPTQAVIPVASLVALHLGDNRPPLDSPLVKIVQVASLGIANEYFRRITWEERRDDERDDGVADARDALDAVLINTARDVMKALRASRGSEGR